MTTQESERTTVHLRRRGEVHSPQGGHCGRLPDYHLSNPGQEMARTVARSLADHDVVRMGASPFEHALLWHDPRRREWSLASLTSRNYEGDTLPWVTYSEPAAGLLERARNKAGA